MNSVVRNRLRNSKICAAKGKSVRSFQHRQQELAGLMLRRLCLSKTISILTLHGHGDSEHCKTFAGSASDHPGEAECAGKLAQAGGTPSRAIAFMRHTVIFLSLSRCRESL